MLEIRIEATESRKRLQKLALAMSPEQRKLNNQKASLQLHADVIRTFAAQGATFSRPKWADLKAGGRWKGRGKGRRFQTIYQVLSDTGALRESYVPLYDEDVAGVGALSVHGHSDLAPVHEFGNLAKNLPARPMLPPTDRALGVVTDVYGLAIQKAALQ